MVELTPDNFDSVTSKGDWIVEFYAPWCGHCQKLAPHLETAAAALAGKGIGIAKVDGAAWRSLTFRFNVGGYPTLFHVHNGEGAEGREVRRLSMEHSVEGVKHAATRGWREGAAPLPWASGPYGPMALAKFWGLYWGERVFKVHEPLARALDVPPMFTGFIFGIILLASFTGALIGCAAWMGPARRNDHDD